MDAPTRTTSAASTPSFGDLFMPKLVTVLREGYGLADLRADALAGLTVAIVALPLSMAIAIASGLTPERGLVAAVVGGTLVSALGGSRFQIGGPAGAFIVLVASAVERHGVEGVVLATMLAGLMLVAIGTARLGTYIKFIPYPVTVGFTAGIAVIIGLAQVKELLGLDIAREPAAVLPKLAALAAALPTANWAAVAVAALTILIILAVRRLRPHWPAFLIAVALASAAAFILALPVETIGSRFGGVPRTLPLPALPELSLDKVRAVLPDAAAFALLGAIESLLSAVVADGMTGRRHRSNCELVAQGAANVGSALFGGMVVTGTIARTATNVRSGARGPVAGMLHAAFLLLFMLLAAPLLAFVPLAALAGVLVVVAWNMVERHAAASLLRSSRGDALALGATFLITVFRDLTEAIVVGSAIGALVVLRRMAQAISIETHVPLVAADRADSEDGGRTPYDAGLSADPDIMVYRISGAFFFGAASTIGAVLDRLAEQPRSFVLDMAAVPFLDSTAANTIEGFSRKLARSGVKLVITGASRSVRHVLVRHGVRPPHVRFTPRIEEALRRLRRAETPRPPRQDAA